MLRVCLLESFLNAFGSILDAHDVTDLLSIGHGLTMFVDHVSDVVDWNLWILNHLVVHLLVAALAKTA